MRHGCWARRLLAAVLLFFCRPAAAAWQVESRDLRTADSVRIRAISSKPTKSWGSGSSNDPVALRSVDYQYSKKAPQEWFLKFNLQPLAGKTVNSAKLKVSKCAASYTCATTCAFAGKCSCPTQFVDQQDCGGGNINEFYSSANDDLHAWHIPDSWSSSLTYADWAQTWSKESRTGVEQCCDQGTGGWAKLGYSHYLGGVGQVGKSGTVEIEVVQAIGTLDPTATAKTGPRYIVRNGYVSFRLTVNGTGSRFFVPEGGDFVYAPQLRLGHVYTTTTTATSSSTTVSTSTTVTTSTSSTTSTTRTTTTLTTTNAATTTARAETTTKTTITTTTRTTTTTTTTTTTSTTTTTTTTTTTKTTTTTITSTITTITTSLTTTISTTIISTTSTFLPTTTTTTSTTSSTLTTSATTTSTPTPSTTTKTTITTRQATTSSTTTTSADTTTTSRTTTSSSSTSTLPAVDVKVTHAFTLAVSNSEVDLAAVVATPSFQASCRSSAAKASGRPVQDVMVVSVALGAGRRLAAASPVDNKVVFQYRIPVNTPAEQKDTVVTLQSSEFARTFGKQFISAERARPKGLSISELDFVRMSTASESFAGEGNQTQNFNREAVGQTFDVFGSPLVANHTLGLWVANATAAIEAAIVKALSTSSIPQSQQTVKVTPGPVLITAAFVRIRFRIHAQVPPIIVASPGGKAIDPDGSMYRERFQSYFRVIENLDNSAEFQETVVKELQDSGVPEMPGMAFGATTSIVAPSDDQSASASVKVVALAVILTVTIVCIGTSSAWLKRSRLRQLTQRCCGSKSHSAHKRTANKEAVVLDDCKVRPFDDDDVSHTCSCGEEVAPDADYCPKCGRKVLSNSVSIQTQTDPYCQLKFALAELGEASKSLRNEFVVQCTSPSYGCRNEAHQNATGGEYDLPNLVDEKKYTRKDERNLAYSDRPRAATTKNQYCLGDDLDRPRAATTKNQYCLGDDFEADGHPCGIRRPSPASTGATELESLESVSWASPDRSNWPSPQRSSSRPGTRRDEARDTDSRPGTRRPGETAPQGPLSNSDVIEVIDVTDTESEQSRNKTPPSRSMLMRALQGGLTLDSTSIGTSRLLPNWTSRRLFRRTMASYSVAEQKNLPPEPPQSNRDGSMPYRLSNVHSLSLEANRSSGSDNANLPHLSDVVEITDL